MWLEPKNDLNVYKEEKTVYGTQMSFETGVERPLSSLSLYGHSTQVTTTGAQLLDTSNPVNSKTEDFSILENGYKIIVKGKKVRSKIKFNILNLDKYLGKTITISADSVIKSISTSTLFVGIIVQKKDSTFSYHNITNVSSLTRTVEIPSDAISCTVDIDVNDTNEDLNEINTVTVVGLNISYTDFEWESYTGGKPSPSPEYPQEIVSVGESGSITVGVAGKNLLTGRLYFINYSNDVSYVYNENEVTLPYTPSKETYGIGYVVPCKPGVQYTFSVANPNKNWYLGIAEYENFKQAKSFLNKIGYQYGKEKSSIKYTAVGNGVLVCAIAGKWTDGETTIHECTESELLQLEYGDVATPYEPYRAPQLLTLQTPNGLPGVPVDKDGNYTDKNSQQWICDEIDLGRGKYVQRVKSFILNGNENWKMSSNPSSPDNLKIRCNISDLKLIYGELQDTYIGIISSHFKGYNWTYVNINKQATGISLVYGKELNATGVAIFSPQFRTVESLKEWLGKNPVSCIAAMENSVERDLTPEEIASYKSIKTYRPTTVISSDAWMQVGYYTSYMETKTNWKSSDFFNVQDYNRIKRNLNDIRWLALTLWPEFTFEEMGEDKNYQDYSFYADEINRFEANVEHICQGTFPFQVGERQTFYDNTPFIGWKELNRLEEACRLMYSNIKSRDNGRKMLPFTLNGGVL